jgi:hypothetical protein
MAFGFELADGTAVGLCRKLCIFERGAQAPTAEPEGLRRHRAVERRAGAGCAQTQGAIRSIERQVAKQADVMVEPRMRKHQASQPDPRSDQRPDHGGAGMGAAGDHSELGNHISNKPLHASRARWMSFADGGVEWS